MRPEQITLGEAVQRFCEENELAPSEVREARAQVAGVPMFQEGDWLVVIGRLPSDGREVRLICGPEATHVAIVRPT